MREILFRGFHQFSDEELGDPDGTLFCSDVNPTEIVLNGKKLKGIWLTGNLISDKGEDPLIVGDSADTCSEYVALEWWAPVIPGTIGQFTGLCDKNGKQIFEGDVVGFEDGMSTESGYAESCRCTGCVFWDKETASFQVDNRLSAESYEVLEECAIIGNIYDGPELIKNEHH
jgi:hypothetical protein